MIKLEFPNESHKDAYDKLIKEWKEFEDISKVSPGRLFVGKDFEEFLNIVRNDILNNENGVNGHLFFLIDDNIKNEIIGAIQVRHHINHPNLIEKGGHIGYGIAPKYRRKGYATIMLSLALEEAKKIGLKKLLLTCYITNIASNKVIQINGGIFERITNDGYTNRYWITL